MTEQDRNKQVVRDYFEQCWNRGDLEFGRDIIADDYDFHMPLPPEFPRGFEGWKVGVGMFLASFPDCHWDIRQILAEDDLVSVRTVWTATHTGEFLGVAATGRRIEVANADYYRMRDGKLVEHWDVPDYLALLRQIGGTIDDAPAMFAASVEG